MQGADIGWWPSVCGIKAGVKFAISNCFVFSMI